MHVVKKGFVEEQREDMSQSQWPFKRVRTLKRCNRFGRAEEHFHHLNPSSDRQQVKWSDAVNRRGGKSEVSIPRLIHSASIRGQQRSITHC
jgi:hypothetical protein